MSPAEPEALKDRLAVYRSLLRRDRGAAKLGRLIDLLESELRTADRNGSEHAPRPPSR